MISGGGNDCTFKSRKKTFGISVKEGRLTTSCHNFMLLSNAQNVQKETIREANASESEIANIAWEDFPRSPCFIWKTQSVTQQSEIWGVIIQKWNALGVAKRIYHCHHNHEVSILAQSKHKLAYTYMRSLLSTNQWLWCHIFSRTAWLWR